MSSIGAILDWSGDGLLARGLCRMAEKLDRRGRDGVDTWSEGKVGLVHAHAWVLPEEVGERQPITSPCGRLRISANARIDNRPELLAELVGLGIQAQSSDAQYILAAYQRWGEDCVQYLVGDFAFALWDADREILLCARDALGVRPLHYSRSGGSVIVASETGTLLAALPQTPHFNRAFLEDLLANAWDRSLHETAYQGVYRVPPGYRITFRRNDVRLVRYWDPKAVGSSVEFGAPECFERFHALLSRAVSDRLRAIDPVGVAVSGGMDSSSIACLAQELQPKQDVQVPVWLLTTIYECTPGADERDYFEAVAARCPALQAERILSDDCWSLREFGTDGGFPLDEPEIGLNRTLLLRLIRQARAKGCRVMLNGCGGDQVLGGEPYHLPHLLQDVGLARLCAELPHFRRCSRRPLWWILLAAYGLPLFGGEISSRLRSLLRGREMDAAGLPLRRPSAAPLALPEPLQAPEFSTRAAAESYRQLTHGLFVASLQEFEIIGGETGVEWRFPFLDRRLVEFMLGVPAAARFAAGWPKRMVREGLRGVLPEKVRFRQGYAHFSGLIERGLREREVPRRQELLRDPLLVSCGLVERERLARAWSYWEDRPQVNCLQPLFSSLLVEAWLRHFSPGALAALQS